MLINFLTNKSFQTATESYGTDAENGLKKNTADLVMCDFKLPSYHDLDLLEKIKIIDLTISVIITGYSDVRVAVEAVRQGTFGWVTKPLHTEEILATIHSAFGSDEPVEASVSKPKKTKKHETT